MTDHQATIFAVSSPIHGRVKVIDELGTLGPSSPASVLSISDHEIQLRVPRSIRVGATVHVRAGEMLVFGQVRAVVLRDSGFDIDVKI